MISLTKDLGIPDEVARAFYFACARFGHRPYVTGVDMGRRLRKNKYTTSTKLCIRIHVKEKFGPRLINAREKLPKVFEGIPVDIIAARYARHGGAADGDGVAPGSSIKNRTSTSGTLGAFVSNGAGDRFLLSAAHVLAPHDSTSPGDIVRPQDGMLLAEAQHLDPLTDSAIAKLGAGIATSVVVVGSGVSLTGCAYPTIGDILEKSGAVTGVTQARVEGFGKYGNGDIDGVGLAFRLVPVQAGQATLISDFGDSGAVWYTTNGGGLARTAIGLHVSGNPDQNPHNQYAVATMMPNVCSRLGVTLP